MGSVGRLLVSSPWSLIAYGLCLQAAAFSQVDHMQDRDGNALIIAKRLCTVLRVIEACVRKPLLMGCSTLPDLPRWRIAHSQALLEL